jgi:parallel beta-helix repeat protein
MKAIQAKVVFVLFFITFSFNNFAQEVETKQVSKLKAVSNHHPNITYAPEHILETGDILYSIQTGLDELLGITLVGNQIIVSSGGASSTESNDNIFAVFDFDGNLLNTYSQGSTTGYGFRDLAYDGTFILGSEDNTIKQINPTTFQISGSITNDQNSPHRGLAFDSDENDIWSTNGSTGPILRMDGQTGQTELLFGSPSTYYKPYGIALDRFTNSENPYLWFAEPWSSGSFRLSMMDCADGLIYYTIDLHDALGNPANCLSGGLDIINNHPDYPDQPIALVVEQNENTIHFVDISGFELPDAIRLSDAGGFGGWVNGGLIANNAAFVFRGNNLNILDLDNNKNKLSSITFNSEPDGAVKAGDYLYINYDQQDETYKKRIEFVDISNLNNPLTAGSFQTSKIMERGVERIVSVGSKIFILTKESVNFGINEKVLMYDISNPISFVYLNELTDDIEDIAVSGNLLFVLLVNGNMKIYDISNGNFNEKGNVAVTNGEKIVASGNYVYAACTSLSGLKVIDITNPELPVVVSIFGNTTHSFYDDILISNSTVFLKKTDLEVVAINVSNPNAPTSIVDFNPDGIGNFKYAGFYSNTIYLIDSGKLFDVDISSPSSPLITTEINEPAMVRGNASIGTTLYTLGDNKLWVYDVDEDGVPVINSSIDIANGNKIFTDGTYLFICDWQNSLYIYNTALQLLSTYNAGNPIIDLSAKNNLLCLVLNNTTTIKLLDYSNPNSPNELSSYDLPYNGKAADLSNDGNSLYAASNKTTIGGNIQGYFQIINISNSNAPILESSQQITGGNTIYNLHIQNNTLFIGGSDRNGWFPLEAWDITDASNPNQIGRLRIDFPGPISDMIYDQSYLYCTIPDPGQVIVYRWDSVAREFFPGPFINSPEPLEITLMDFETTPGYSKLYSKITGDGDQTYNYAVVNNGTTFQQYSEGSKGNRVVKVIKVPKQVNPALANLMMVVNPASAADNGCTTTPAPGGPYTYIKNSTVAISAIDNPDDGWLFKEWTGASGDANTTVLMSDDKVVIANFAEVKLTVSGSEMEEAICPDDAKNDKQKILPINLCASDADGWAVQSIKFKSSGTGNELDCTLEVYKGSELIGTGNYNADNGECLVTFTPNVIVPLNECVTVDLYYKFTFDDPNYVVDTTYTFLVETKNVNAAPLVFPSGLIEGKARRRGAYTIARIYNDWGIGFSKIQDAVNSEYTPQNGTCYLCEGTYTENVIFNEDTQNGVTVTSANGRENTILKTTNESLEIFKVIDINDIKIKNLTFMGPGQFGVNNYRTSSGEITGNKFKDLENGVVLGDGAKYVKVHSNEFNSLNTSIALVNSEYSDISYNTITNSKSDGESNHTISLFKSNLNVFFENSLSAPEGKITINSWYGQSNQFVSNDFTMEEGKTHYPLLSLKQTNLNIVNKNKGLDVYLESSNDNKISYNELLRLKIKKSNDNSIESNNITGKNKINGDGIYLNESEKNTIDGNTIKENKDNGVYLTFLSKKNTLKNNNIYNNKKNGISISGSYDNNIFKEKIYNNEENGINFYGGSADIYKSKIYNNDQNGIYVFDAGGIAIIENKIIGHNKSYAVGTATSKGSGVYLSSASNCFINRNIFKENCTGINSNNSRNLNISGNEVDDNFCLFTGIHLDNTDAEIIGNNILNNNGNGVYFTNNSYGNVHSNNISGNTEKGVSNDDPNVEVDVSGNWWGNENGPTEDDISGNLDVSSWLSSPASLVSQILVDTLFSAAGINDSVTAHIRDLSYSNSSLMVKIAEDKNWISEATEFPIQLHDSTGYLLSIPFNVPADNASAEFNKIVIEVSSDSDSTKYLKDSVYVGSYIPITNQFRILPDSTTITVNDTINFFVEAEDQFGNEINLTPTWSASEGNINSEGAFFSSLPTESLITAIDSVSGLHAITTILVTEEQSQLAGIFIVPDSVTIHVNETFLFEAHGFNEHGFPHFVEVNWRCDCGSINEVGLYTADSTSRFCTVMAEDTTNGIIGFAHVVVEGLVSVEQDVMPTEYKLSRNYPNPFNPTTTINYQLPEFSKVQLIIYDVLGREIKKLVNAKQPAGKYQITFDASKLSSGIYFYKLISNSFVQTNKMIYLK